MTATLDANVLLYASHTASPFHSRAVDVVDRIAEGPDLFYLFWPAVFGYLRISTHPAVFERPLTAAEAASSITDLLDRPHIRVAGEVEGFWNAYLQVIQAVAPRGNLVPDAHLVTLMRQHGVSTIWSHDRDFRKFDGITVRDPFA